MRTAAINLREPLLMLAILVLETVLLVTLIGTVDEGNMARYGSLIVYLKQGGIPPLSDYILWSVVNVTLGIPAFFVISESVPARSFAMKAALTLFIPVAVFGILFTWGILISIA